MEFNTKINDISVAVDILSFESFFIISLDLLFFLQYSCLLSSIEPPFPSFPLFTHFSFHSISLSLSIPVAASAIFVFLRSITQSFCVLIVCHIRRTLAKLKITWLAFIPLHCHHLRCVQAFFSINIIHMVWSMKSLETIISLPMEKKLSSNQLL